MVKVEKMRFKTYLAIIQNSVSTKMFSEGYAKIDGRTVNILKGGEVSCAFFVSGVLSLFDVKLIDHTHTTVASTVRALKVCGWQELGQPADSDIEPGDIIVWESKPFPGGAEHSHIGFAVLGGEAISNDYVSGTPQRHPLDKTPDGSPRKIDSVFRGRHLFDSAS